MTGGIQCFLKPLIGKPVTNDEGFLDHAYMPSFMHDRQRKFARSFGAQFNYQNRRSAGWAKQMPGFGLKYKESIKERYPAYLTFTPYGEKLPDSGTYIDLDPERKDEYGLPLARRHVVWNDNDMTLFHEMVGWSKEILLKSRAEILQLPEAPRTNHELGGCRMGSDPKTSVLDAFCRAHDVPNLYVVDGSVFPSASEKNPTHTMMALAARTADHIADRLKKGEL
jgi:choline dehydrogenase-like flavoprotein